jgi:cytochrome bd-type quinol oxidase subunit 2
LAQHPYIVVPDLTFVGTATDPKTLYLLKSALLAGAVVLLPSFVYLFYVFKRRPI